MRYDDDGEEEDLTWEEIVPLLPVREASERVLKKTKSCWLRQAGRWKVNSMGQAPRWWQMGQHMLLDRL